MSCLDCRGEDDLVHSDQCNRHEPGPDSDDPGLITFTIVTTEPNALCADVHDRMPVILSEEDWEGWLGTPEQRTALLRPFPAEKMQMWPVGKDVGNVKNEEMKLIERVWFSAA